MAEKRIGDGNTHLVDSLLQGMEHFLEAKTVIGEATNIDDTIILPLVDVQFGMGVGGNISDKANKSGGGMGAKMSPSAVLVIKNGQTRLVNIKNQDAITKVIDLVPDLVDKITNKFDKKVKDEDVVEAAFPDECEE